jgi:pilus assembly protein CpaB
MALTAAIVLGIAAAVTAALYLTGSERQLEQGMQTMGVLVASQDIPGGTPVSQLVAEKRLEVRQVAKRYAVEGALGSLKGMEDRVLSTPLVKGDQLATARLDDPAKAGVSYTLTKGQVAVTVPLDDVRGVAGFVKPGDWVAVFGTVKTDADDENSYKTTALLPRTLVLAVGQTTAKPTTTASTQKTDDGFGGGGTETNVKTSVTLAVTAPEAERLVFTAERGKLWLVLQAGTDTAGIKTGGQTAATVLGK